MLQTPAPISLGQSILVFLTRWALASGFVAVSVVLLALFTLGGLTRLDSMAMDQQFRWLSNLHQENAIDDVVVVGIDEASLKEFSVPVAILHRQIGGFFEAMALGRARGVGIDVVLPAVSFDHVQPGLDAALARGMIALRSVAPLVIGQTAGADGQLRAIHPLYTTLTGPEGSGMVLVIKDNDGAVRRFDERIGVDRQELISMPGRLARRLGAPVQHGIVPFYRGAPMPYIPLNEVLGLKASGDIAGLQKRFAGKVVLLGTLLDYDDLHRVAVALAVGDAPDATHGVFVLARQLHSLLKEDLIREAPPQISLLLILFATCTWWFKPGRRVYVGVAVAILGVIAASLKLLLAGWALPCASVVLAMAAGLGGRTVWVSLQNAAERRHLKSAFGGFVSPSVLEEILSGRLAASLNGERRMICVLFSDIRNFTTLSEKMAPEAVTEFLNRYFELMVGCIHQNGGTIDKFMGDGIMAFFGAPRDVDNPCEDAFRAATTMLIKLEELNGEWEKENHQKLSIGIGLNYGPAFLGYIGSKDRHEYSAIGDAVNLAARLEGLTKGSGYPIMVSSTVLDSLPQVTGFTDLGKQAVKGRSDAHVFGWKPSIKGSVPLVVET